MRNFTHHHITRHDNQIFVGTQNPLPEFELSLNDQHTDNLSNNQNNTKGSNSDIQTNNAGDINNTNRMSTDVRRCSSMNMQSSSFTYTVQEDDTLDSISDRFHIRKSLIKSANRIFDDDIHPGQSLILFTNFNVSQRIDPIDVCVYDAKEQTDGPSGKLSIKNFELIFTPKSIFVHSHHINLSGHLESSVFLHPSSNLLSDANFPTDQPYILVINYLKNPPNRNTSVTEYFSGNKSDLEKYWIEILKVADLAQEKNQFKAPNPNSIYYSQDFADKVNMPIRTRRNNSQNKRNDSTTKITPAATQTMIVFLPQIQFLNGKMEILKQTDVFLIRKQLSQRYQNLNWTRVFKTTVDGLSLATFFRRVANKRPLLFFLKTTDDDIIGAFIPTSIIISDSHYGSGEMFLFRFKTEIQKKDQITSETLKQNSDQIDPETTNDASEQKNNPEEESSSPTQSLPKPRTIIETFRWNQLKNMNNKLFILSNMDCILFGGGKTSALYINKDMYGGYSDHCETFNSPRLTKNRKFDVSLIEVWQIG